MRQKQLHDQAMPFSCRQSCDIKYDKWLGLGSVLALPLYALTTNITEFFVLKTFAAVFLSTITWEL